MSIPVFLFQTEGTPRTGLCLPQPEISLRLWLSLLHLALPKPGLCTGLKVKAMGFADALGPHRVPHQAGYSI